MKKKPLRIFLNIMLLLLVLLCAGLIVMFNISRLKTKDKREQEVQQEYAEAEEVVGRAMNAEYLKSDGAVPRPEVDEQLLTVNPYSRPGKKMKKLKAVVIHYLGNPETTAQQNRDYFESLKDLKDTSMSSNYVIGLEGEIIQCVPDDEVAYASNQANSYSISIENCNIDSTGKFMRETYISLVKLVAYLTAEYDLGRDQILRHYDVTGKECPRYYVDNEESWETFKDDVMNYRALCEAGDLYLFDPDIDLKGLKETYQSKDEKQEGDTSADVDSEHGGKFEGKASEEEEEENWDPYEGYEDTSYTGNDSDNSNQETVDYTPPSYTEPSYGEPDYGNGSENGDSGTNPSQGGGTPEPPSAEENIPSGDEPSGGDVPPSEDIPSEDIPSEDIPSEDIPSGDIPSGDTPSEEVPYVEEPSE
ncbi:MAG: N-acetylmuramoyl-L-alanine amidase [Muricoprocola sp.]